MHTGSGSCAARYHAVGMDVDKKIALIARQDAAAARALQTDAVRARTSNLDQAVVINGDDAARAH